MTVDLPFLESMDGVMLDVGTDSVRIGLPGTEAPRLIELPEGVRGGAASTASARFSRKRGQLLVALPVNEVGAAVPIEPAAVEPADVQPRSAAASPNGSQAVTASCGPSVQGSVWNADSWHWEERNMTKWTSEWFVRELQGFCCSLADGTADFAFMDVCVADAGPVKGEASLSVRKRKPVLDFTLSIVCRWRVETRSVDGALTRGCLRIPDFCSDDAIDDVEIQMDATIDQSKGRYLSGAVRQEVTPLVRRLLLRYTEEMIGTCQKGQSK